MSIEDVSLEDAFAAVNPPDIWVEVKGTCDECGEEVVASAPPEVRATVQTCGCGASVVLYRQKV